MTLYNSSCIDTNSTMSILSSITRHTTYAAVHKLLELQLKAKNTI